jgi:hypothetical protein
MAVDLPEKLTKISNLFTFQYMLLAGAQARRSRL